MSARLARPDEWREVRELRLRVLETNESARGLYESCGYAATGERRDDDPRSILLAKTL